MAESQPVQTQQAQPSPVIPVPEGWEKPTYVIGEVVWHECQQYEVIGLAIDKSSDSWRYIVNRHPEAAHTADPETLSLLEWQVGSERPAWCDQTASSQSETGSDENAQ